ncbi:MAG: hypothetical protein ACE1Y1_00755, partial [Nitrosomonadaceae bacterium]
MKMLKLMCLTIVLLGSITSGSIWAAARGGEGHGGGGDHHAAGVQHAEGRYFSGEQQPFAGESQIVRRGGRGYRGG